MIVRCQCHPVQSREGDGVSYLLERRSHDPVLAIIVIAGEEISRAVVERSRPLGHGSKRARRGLWVRKGSFGSVEQTELNERQSPHGSVTSANAERECGSLLKITFAILSG